MPVSLEWLDQDKTLIYIVAKDRLSFDEALIAANQLRDMLATVPHPVEAIAQVTPPSFFSRRYGESLRTVHHSDFPNLRLMVFVGHTIVWELFINFARHFGRLNYNFAMRPTFEEALDLIQQFRNESDLPPSSSSRWN